MSKRARNIITNFLSMLLVFTMMSPNMMLQAEAEPTLEPGDIVTNKTATPVHEMVNMWDIEVDFTSRNNDSTSDIILVIDLSLSMRGNPIDRTKTAAKNFIKKMYSGSDERIRIAIVTYSDNSYLVKDFSDYTKETEMLNAITNLDLISGTNTQSGMRRARLLMDTSDADFKTIVLMSDGEPRLSYGFNGNITADLLENSSPRQQTKRGINVSRYDDTKVVGNTGTTFKSQCTSNCNGFTFDYSHSNAALNERDQAVDDGYIIYSIGLNTNTETNAFMKEMASSDSHVFFTSDLNVDSVYDAIAGGIKNTTSKVTLIDELGPGFELVGDITSESNNSTTTVPTVLNRVIEWKIGDPTEEYFKASIKYRVRATDALLNVASTDGTFPTNGPTYITYTNNAGTEIQHDIDVPWVKPTRLEVIKIYKDDSGAEITSKDYEFDMNIFHMSTGVFSKDITIHPGEENKFATYEFYKFGSYAAYETGASHLGENIDLMYYIDS